MADFLLPPSFRNLSIFAFYVTTSNRINFSSFTAAVRTSFVKIQPTIRIKIAPSKTASSHH
jgi:hypothetical protein